MSESMFELPYRENVCLIVRNRDGKFFLGQRLGSPEVWQFPQGGVEEGTALEENVLRELEEELGAEKANFKIVRKLEATNRYDFEIVPDYAKGRWRGQQQSFWLIDFLGEDSAICLDRYDAEFSAWRWCSLKEVLSIAEPKRLRGYKPALDEIAGLG